MTKKSTEKRTVSVKSSEDVRFNRRKEWRLELPLNAAVEGTLPQGKKFKEKTTLVNISSTGAYFYIDSAITIGSKLELSIDIPAKLSEGRPLRLSLSGEAVRLEKSDLKGKKQGVALRFDKEFMDEKFHFVSEK